MIDYNVNDRRDASERSTPATRGMVDIGDYSGGIVFEKNMGAEESLDVVEKLFVACRFTEAATVSSQVLLSLVSTLGRRSEESTTAVPVVNFGDDFINPVGECDVADLIVAVLLQCGYELRRKEDWGRCRAFYSIRGPMPFDVAILWLRLRQAGGETDVVRKVLWKLRTALGEELRSRAASNASDPVEDSSDTTRANYVETMEMLVVQAMLRCGKGAEATSLVSSDPYLKLHEKEQLVKVCAASAGQLGVDSCTEGAPDEALTAPGSLRRGTAGTAGGSRGDELATSRTSDHPPGARQRLQPGPIRNLFPNVLSDWTPEARFQLVLGTGAAGLALIAALRNRRSLWHATRTAAALAMRTAGDVGNFIIGSS